jgi:hypothetical protein
MDKNNRLWVWGYVLDDIPGNAPFVNLPTFCSLETACSYLGADNAVFMNSMGDITLLNEERLGRLAGMRKIVCALQHRNYLESAKAVSRLSKTFPNIRGAIIDDFLDRGYAYRGSSADMTPTQLKAVRDALRSENQELELYVVRYTWQDPEELLPYKDFFDVLNLWVWISTADYWDARYYHDINRYRCLYEKPIMQGLFLHHYGLAKDHSAPMTLKLMQTQCKRAGDELRVGNIQDWCILQSGWFSRETHRRQLEWFRNYLTWFYGTWSKR